MLHRSKIDHDDAEVPLVYHFSAVSRGHAMRDLDRWKVVPRGEIFINPSDPKHVAWLLRYSDGLCVVITAGIGHLGVF